MIAAIELTTREADNGFPILRAHTVVGLWSAFETAIEDCIVAMLFHEPEVRRYEPFSKMKISLAAFEALEKEERMRLLFGELERSPGVASKYGVERFEALLSPFKLSGEVDKEIKKPILEMQQQPAEIFIRSPRTEICTGTRRRDCCGNLSRRFCRSGSL